MKVFGVRMKINILYCFGIIVILNNLFVLRNLCILLRMVNVSVNFSFIFNLLKNEGIGLFFVVNVLVCFSKI